MPEFSYGSREDRMKVLLIGPYPPPHGGISVHVSEAHRFLSEAGVESRVLNIDRRAKPAPDYERVRHGPDLFRITSRHAGDRSLIHVHINGHNRRAWFVAAACALAGRRAPARVLTLHSGMTPAYINSAPRAWRSMLRSACLLYSCVVCVNAPIQQSIVGIGMPKARTQVLPAFAPIRPLFRPVPAELERWMQSHRPLISTTLFFRPEYGFDLLVNAMPQLRSRHPGIGCLVMGSREGLESEQFRLQQHGMESHFRFLGDVEHDLCLTLISECDLYVRPTLEDGDSISVREALHLGVPVVASDVGVRPAAAVLFGAGDVRHMIARIEETLSKAHLQTTGQYGTRLDETGLDRLLDIYRALQYPEADSSHRAGSPRQRVTQEDGKGT
jgi:glycogen synthase